MSTYLEHIGRYAGADGRLNDFISLRDGRVIFADTIDLLELARAHNTPLELSFCPLITGRVAAMRAHFAAARERAGYAGQFVYAYATKANFAEEVVRTAINAGAHYETSSAFDVRIAHQLWRAGLLPGDRFVFCNGSKEPAYISAIRELREAGFANVVPILDDPEEFEALADCPAPLLLGVRERKDAGDMAAGITYGYDRFGMGPAELAALADRVAASPHRLLVYHAMVGSQLEQREYWLAELRESLAGYAQLRERAPELAYFNFGGGMPTGAYSLSFGFDYAEFAGRLLADVAGWCQARGVPHPHLVGEFGRYTAADHGVHLFQVGRVKRGQAGSPPWYLLNGSLMVALPDILIVKGQQFICLPLNHLGAEAGPAVLGGRRTCDSDDFYPREGDPELILPLVAGVGSRESEVRASLPQPPTPDSQPLVLAFFGTGAYQAMLSGEGGAHHCLAPEAPKLIVEQQGDQLVTRVIGEQSWDDVLGELGYPIAR